MEPNQNKKPNGALIGSIIVILIIVLGGVYFWASKQKAEAPNQPTQATGTNETASVINSTTDQELNNLDTELGQQKTSADINVDVNAIQ